MKDQSDDPSYHERTFLLWSYISLQDLCEVLLSIQYSKEEHADIFPGKYLHMIYHIYGCELVGGVKYQPIPIKS